MTAEGVALDVPARDPGLPRFLVVVAACALAGAALVAVRPEPLDAPAAGADVAGDPTPDAGLTGAGLFLREGCGECHATSGPSSALGPSLAGVWSRAQSRVIMPGYAGDADTAEGYLREATLAHCVDLLPGYTCPDVSEVGLRLSLDEVDRIVRFMAGLSDGGSP